MTKSNKKYYLFHLLNDFSGSPMVLRQVAETMRENGSEVTVVTSKSEGFLSSIDGVRLKPIDYKWNPNKLITLVRFLWVQVRLFFYAVSLPEKSSVYVNTLLPFGAACGAYLRRFEVIYHLHEPQVQPRSLFKLLKKVSKITSEKQIYVSHYLAETLKDIWVKNRKVIHNSVSESYQVFTSQERQNPEKFTVLMACSQKRYKGVYEFLELARKCNSVNFKLILNSEGEIFNDFLNDNIVPENCIVLPVQNNMLPHYLGASLVTNLSHKDLWIESFGLTIVEAMCFGLPVIAPDIGGPVEIIEDGVSGFLIDVKNLQEIADRINELSNDRLTYNRMSNEAKENSKKFGIEQFKTQIAHFLS